ncbi:MAG: orotidine-5'-phosphate decarboxylase, partial [Polyangiales bacterium]
MTDALAAARSRLALALDVPDLPAAREWIAGLGGEVGVFKVGLELYTAAGPDAARAVTDAGAELFLDLKLHDIPATVGRSVQAAARLGARYATVHAANGPEGLRAAAAAANGTGTRVLAVTVLTSMDQAQLDAIGLRGPVDEAVLRLARLAVEAGIDGLVASPRECAALRRELGSEAVIA